MRGIIAVLLLLPALAGAQDTFRPEGRYDPRVPEQAAVLGFASGERPAHHGEIVRYMEALAAGSPRVRLERYGKTHEGRDLLLAIISSEENLSRLAEIRETVSALADPRRQLTPGELEKTVDHAPAVAFMAYSIHGDEFSGADAALRLAYELAASEAPDIERIRKEVLVLLDPAQNPDGRERMLAITATFTGAVPNPDPDSLSHEGVWPWGRTNHYFFDLNRDWFVLIHPESRGKARILKTWRPQLVVDSHEMGSESTYLFNPPRAPFNPYLPSHTLSWWERFAADQAKAFDRRGWSYFTREWNEEFFPGYGSAVSLYQGSVGILHEQAGTVGQPIRQPHGAVLTYQGSVERQFVSSLSNLQTAASNRRDLMLSYIAARREAVERGLKGPVRAFYFTPRPYPARAARLATSLAMLGIEVEQLPQEGRLAGARTVWEDGAATVSLPAGSFRVRLDQPDGLLASVILSPHSPMPDSFLAEEREHLERRKESRVYDITGWSFLLGSGVEAFWTSRLDGLDWKRVEAPKPAQGKMPTGQGGYGWLFDGSTDGALTLAADLVCRGFKVRAGKKPFTVQGHALGRGSFLLRAEENPKELKQALLELAPGRGVEVVWTPTALAEKGPDLGGGQWTLLTEPRIAILAGPPSDYTSVGAAWHLLDSELSIRVSLLDISRLGRVDLRRYNVLVMPSAWGGAEAYKKMLGDKELSLLRTWIEEGGTLVSLGGGAAFVTLKESDLSAVRLRQNVLEEFSAPRFGLDPESIKALELMQGTGLGPDGTAVRYAGPYSEEQWPEALKIPGPGSPLLGPGTWAMLGEAGEAARRRSAQRSTGASGKGEAKEGKAANAASEEEAERARKRADERLRRFMPSGAIVRLDLEPEHWLAFGAGERVAVMAGEKTSFIARDPVRIIGRLSAPERLHLGGLLWPEAAGRMAHTAWLTREKSGRGQIILFAGDPNFRGYFWGTERLFLNAVLLGPGMGTEKTVPW